METRIMLSYRLTLDADEFRILSKALRGNLTGKDEADALQLQIKMMRVKHKQIMSMMKESERAMNNIAAAEGYIALRKDGKPFECQCGSDLFKRFDEDPTHFKCKDCGRSYEGEPHDSD